MNQEKIGKFISELRKRKRSNTRTTSRNIACFK